MNHFKLNIHDLNFILTFSGFAIFTSFFADVSSIVYRAFALLVALLCLLKSSFKLADIPTLVKVLLAFIIILDLKIAYHLLFDISIIYIPAKRMALLFVFGVTLIPVLAFSAGYKHIHWKSVLVVLELLLFITILKSYLSTIDEMDAVRMALNNRQSTIAYGDNSSYLFILSLCLLRCPSEMKNRLVRSFWVFFLICGTILGLIGMIRAGSRGPVISAVMGLAFYFVSLKFRKQMGFLATSVFLIAFFGISTVTLEKVAPVLFSRMYNAIEEGDTSGRDILFREAIAKIKDNPIEGDNPIILSNNGQFTTCHNGYLTVGVCLGVLGLFFYVMLTIWIAIRLILCRVNINSSEGFFIASMYFLSITRAMTGADIASNPNYAVMIVAASILISKAKYEKGKL